MTDRELLEAAAKAAGLADEWTAFEAIMPAADSLGGTFAWQGWQACLKHSPSRVARVSAPVPTPKVFGIEYTGRLLMDQFYGTHEAAQAEIARREGLCGKTGNRRVVPLYLAPPPPPESNP